MARFPRFSSSRAAALVACILAVVFLVSCHRYQSMTEDDKRDKAVLIWSDAYEKYEKKGDYQRAIVEYQNALSIKPRPAILYHLGHCYAQTGDYDRARNYLRQALEMKPGYEMAEVELARVNNLDPKGAREAGMPKPMIRNMSLNAQATAAPTAAPEAAPQLKTSRGTLPAGEPLPPQTDSQTRRQPVLLIDDGSEAPAPTVQGTVPQPLPAPPELQKVAGAEAIPSLPDIEPTPIASRVADVRPTPVLRKIEEPTATLPPIIPTLPKTTPTPKGGELPVIVINRPRAEATPTPAVVAQATPKIIPTVRPTLPPTPTFAPPTARPVAPTATPVPPKPTPVPTNTPFLIPTPHVVLIVPTRAPTPVPTATPATPTVEDVQKTLFSGSPTPYAGTERPAPEMRPTPSAISSGEAGASLDSFAYHYEQGAKFLEHKEYQRSISELRKALQFDERHLEGLLKLGDAYKKAGRTQQALAEYERAVQYHPNEPRTYLKIGNLYINDKDPENLGLARRAYREAVRVDPQYKQAYNNLGILDMQAGNIDDAIENFKRVIAIDNDYPNAHLNLGILYEEYKRNKMEAYAHYKEYVRLGGRRSDEVRKWMEQLQSK